MIVDQSPYQPVLPFLEELTQPAYPPGLTIRQRFEIFHDANPTVFSALRQMALQLKARGARRGSMKALMETLRWLHQLTVNPDDSGFKLNNNFTALYARLLMDREPALEGFFETRARRAQ